MPDKPEGQNPRIHGSPWFVHKPAVPYYKALPPSYPPPSHLLPFLNAPQAESTPSTCSTQFALLVVNKSLKSSTSISSHASSNPVSLKAAPSTRTRIPFTLFYFCFFFCACHILQGHWTGF